ncbi:MAG: hypothetical protein LBP34_06025 [Flavobacteriaceae bacterium]|jgi:hypothetical protein|nr:hypothetical protein [Flavobacteriaceae bacterium]
MERGFGENKLLILILILLTMVSCSRNKSLDLREVYQIKVRTLRLDSNIKREVLNFSNYLDSIKGKVSNQYTLTFFTYKDKRFLYLYNEVIKDDSLIGSESLGKDTVYVYFKNNNPEIFNYVATLNDDSSTYTFVVKDKYAKVDPRSRCYRIQENKIQFIGDFNCYGAWDLLDEQMKKIEITDY